MITIKNKDAIEKMYTAGQHLAEMFDQLQQVVVSGISTYALDQWIETFIRNRKLVSEIKGYGGYRFVSCISRNDELVHGLPSLNTIIKEGDLIKIDVCASWKGYCADMARPFVVDIRPDCLSSSLKQLIEAGQKSLDAGIAVALPGRNLFDISSAIEQVLIRYGYGVVRDFVGHGIGRSMHEDPEVPNFGIAGKGPKIVSGMAFALEPMFTEGSHEVFVDADGWTVKTSDKSLAMHHEDTVIITQQAPLIITRHCSL